MAKLKIFTFPDTILANKAEPVQRVEKTLYRLADDMLETMYDAPGVGLAANQIGILQRILVLDVDYDLEELPEGTPSASTLLIKNKNPQIVINPEIIEREGSILSSEGCLSVPEYYAEVKRAKKVKFQFQTIDGLTRTISAEGLLACAIQHEIDHLDGKLFIERLSPLKKEMIRKRLRQERLEREMHEKLDEQRLFDKRSKSKKKDF